MENVYLNCDVIPRIFYIFRIKVRALASTFFSLRIFLDYLCCMKEKSVLPYAHKYPGL